jgi:hypothetical protein
VSAASSLPPELPPHALSPAARHALADVTRPRDVPRVGRAAYERAPLRQLATTITSARAAGVAWADRAALASPPRGPWRGTPDEAHTLAVNARTDLARCAHNAAAERWAELCVELPVGQALAARDLLADAFLAIGYLRAAERLARLARLNAARPPSSLRAERLLLVGLLAERVTLADVEGLRGDDFAAPIHPQLFALLVAVLEVAGRMLSLRALESGLPAMGLHAEAVGYLRWLGHAADRRRGLPAEREEDPAVLVLRVATLARQRRASELADRAIGQLRNPCIEGCDHGATARELRRAADLLEGAQQ